jgi:hypothetical protein
VNSERDTYRIIILHSEDGAEVGVPIRLIRRLTWQPAKNRTAVSLEGESEHVVFVTETPHQIHVMVNRTLSGQYEC